MKPAPSRRALLLAAVAAPLAQTRAATPAQDRLAALESSMGGRLGVAALNTADGARLGRRMDERFPFCSTFKVLAAAAILRSGSGDAGLLGRRVTYTREDLVPYSPITEKHVDDSMTWAEVCAAALRYSDNTAGNLMIDKLGGSSAVTAFARSIGDDMFRLDRRETALNTAIPDDLRDTTTPGAMASTLRHLMIGDALGEPERVQLVDWMAGNTTGAKRIRAGIPADWSIADKTGTGDYGTSNDVGLLRPPGAPPIVLAIYLTQPVKDAKPRDDIVAAAARIVVEALSAG